MHTAVQDTYLSIIRNRNHGPGSISYFREGALHTNFKISTLEFLIFPQNISPDFLF